MVLVSETQGLISMETRGKFGKSGGCGFACPGNTRCASSKLYGGVYERKLTKNGWRISRQRHSFSGNPQTETQQAWRDIFKNGVIAWHDLTTSERQAYNNLKSPARQSGFTRFMSQYLSENVA